MPCPLFVPDLEAPPIGEPFTGCCDADPVAEIPFELLSKGCNRGYARSFCTRAAQVTVDAHQFLIKSDADGIFRVAWSAESEHAPVAVGTLEIRPNDRSDTPLERQARASVAAYLRRTGGVW